MLRSGSKVVVTLKESMALTENRLPVKISGRLSSIDDDFLCVRIDYQDSVEKVHIPKENILVINEVG